MPSRTLQRGERRVQQPCHAIGDEQIARHSHLRDVLYQTAQLSPCKEPDGLLHSTDERPADILLPYWTHDKDTAIEVTRVNALQSGMVGQGAADGGYAVALTHRKKVKKFGECCEAEGMTFLWWTRWEDGTGGDQQARLTACQGCRQRRGADGPAPPAEAWSRSGL